MTKRKASTRDVEQFLDLYVEFARSYLATSRKRMREHGIDAFEDVKKPPWYSFTPSMQDAEYPGAVAEACAKIIYRNGWKKLKLSRDDGSEIPNPTYKQVREHLMYDLSQPISNLIRQRNTFRLSPRAVRSQAERYVHAWLYGGTGSVCMIPLAGLTGTLLKAAITDDVSVQKATRSDLDRLRRYRQMFRYDPLDEYPAIEYVIKRRVVGPNNEEQRFAHEAGTAVTALRLAQSGTVGVPAMFTEPLLPADILGGFQRLIEFETSGRMLNNDATLTRSIAAKARHIAKQLNAHGASGPLSLALRRYNLMYSRTLPEDRIIDLAIVCESALLPNDKEELKLRMRVRAAQLCRPELAAKRTSELIRRLYDVRSNIVHNAFRFNDGKIEKEIHKGFPEMQPGHFLVEAQNLVRLILVQMLDRVTKGESLKNICEALDARAF